MEEELAKKGTPGRQVAGARWREQPERRCRGAVWIGKVPAK